MCLSAERFSKHVARNTSSDVLKLKGELESNMCMSAWSVARYHSQGADQDLAESEQVEKSTVLLRTFA